MPSRLAKYRRLTRHFARGLTDNDLIAPDADLHATIAGLIAAFLVVSAGVALMFLGKYNSVAFIRQGGFRAAPLLTLAQKTALALDDKALLLGVAMLVMGILTVVFWDALTLDSRDFAVLGPLPVRPATVLAAKTTAVVGAASVAALAVNALPALLFPVVVLLNTPVSLTHVLGWIAAYGTAGLAGCAFTFLALSTLREATDLVLPRRLSRVLLPLAQFLLVLALLSLLLAAPLLAARTRLLVDGGSRAIVLCPPLWFLGLEEVLIGRNAKVFQDLARIAVAALTISAAAAAAVHLCGFFRKAHSVDMLASSCRSRMATILAAGLERLAARLASDRRARASFLFAVRTLTRSPRHRLYLAGALGLGLSVSAATIGAAYGGVALGRSALGPTTMSLAAQLNLLFFLIIGIRMSAAVPADLEAAWVFRFHATPSVERHLAGTRSAVFFLAVLPLLALLFPLHTFLWGVYAALVHFAFGVAIALLLLEVVFKDCDRLPFVCAFIPGRTLLSLRWPLYVFDYALLVYVTPSVERLLVERAAMFYAWVALFVVVTWRMLRSQMSGGRHDRLPVFDAPPDVIELGLSGTAPGRRRTADDTLTRRPGTGALPTVASGVFFSTVLSSRRASASGLPSAVHRPVTLRDRVRAAARLASQLRVDVAHASRRLRLNLGFTFFSILTLALGIGATTAIYSVIYSSVLRPLAVHDLGRLVNIYHSNPYNGGSRSVVALSLPDFSDLAATQTVFSGVAAHAPFAQVAIVNGVGEKVLGEVVSGTYFSVLGVQPAVGRMLQPADDRPGAPPVAVIADRLWRRRFNSDPQVVGHTVRMAGRDFEIVGVGPAEFRGVELPNLAPTSIWLPLAAATVVGAESLGDDREARWLVAKARLAPGRSVKEAQAAVALIGRRLDAAHPIGRDLAAEFRSPPAVSRQWSVVPAGDRLVTERGDATMLRLAALTMLAVGLVLLVACTNLANLSLARGTSRRREVGVRLALGASRWQVIREQMVESAIVAMLGGVTAMGVARLLIAYGLTGSVRYGAWITIDVAPRLDSETIVVAFVSTVLALIVCGLFPALHLTSVNPATVVGGQGATGVSVPWRGRRLLIAGQVAVSVALVAMTGLSVRYIAQTAGDAAGRDLDRLAAVRFDFASQGWDSGRARDALAGLAAEARRQPGFEAVTVTSGLPGETSGSASGNLATPDRPFDEPTYYGRRVAFVAATPSVFRTFGIRLLTGRCFDDRDVNGSAAVVVLSEMAAKSLFKTAAVTGRQVIARKSPAEGGREGTETLTVVGVVSDAAGSNADKPPEGVAFLPFAQHYDPRVAIVVRTARSAQAVTALETITHRLQPELGIIDAGSGRALAGVENIAFEVMAVVAAVLGVLALLLAMVGLYGVLSYVVVQRTHEIGIRLALGASSVRIIGPVVLDGLRPVVEGLIAGFVLADLAAMATRPAFTTPLPAIDATLLSLVPVPFLAAALLASYVPARRASRVSPNAALRQI